MNDETMDLILSVFEASMEAQLRTVRRLRHGEAGPAEPRLRKGPSQVDMAFDILKKARAPLHVSAILDRNKFTPEQVRQDAGREYKTTRIFYGGKRR
jgi:hypothetical protein